MSYNDTDAPCSKPVRRGTLISFELGVLFAITPIIVAGLWFVMGMKADLNSLGISHLTMASSHDKDVADIHERITATKTDLKMDFRQEISQINSKLDLILETMVNRD